MAIRQRKATTRGQLRLPPALDIREGLTTRQSANDLDSWLREVAQSINGALSFGDGLASTIAGNLDAQWIRDVKFTPANTRTAIPHGLGRAPVGYLVTQQNLAGSVYCTGTSEFGRDTIYLKGSTNNMICTLLVF